MNLMNTARTTGNKFYYYLSSGWGNRHYIGELIKELERAQKDSGQEYPFEVSFDWTDDAYSNDTTTLPREKHYRDISDKEIEGIRVAHVVIGILPGGRGTHIELGAAMGLRKPIYLFAHKSQEPLIPFYYQSSVTLIGGPLPKYLNVPNIKQEILTIFETIRGSYQNEPTVST